MAKSTVLFTVYENRITVKLVKHCLVQQNCCQIKANSIMIVYDYYLSYLHVTLEKLSYSKYSKISSTFLFLFSNDMLIFRGGIHILLVRKANSEGPD